MNRLWNAFTRSELTSSGSDERARCAWSLRAQATVPCQKSGFEDAEHRVAFVEEFRFLASRLYHLRQHREVRSVLLTSAIPAEGKSLIAANLAVMLALGGGPVVLIDGDLRAPSLHHVLGVPERPGLSQVLGDGLPVLEAVQHIDDLGLHFLSAGGPSDRCAERLQDPGTRKMLADGLKNFDWIVLDSPPLGAFADAHYLATMSDTVLLVARADTTPRPALRQAVAALAGSEIAGIVLNGADTPARASYYNRYTDFRGSR